MGKQIREYRKIAKSGTICLPASLRRELGLRPMQAMEIEVLENNTIQIKPYEIQCYICGSKKEIAVLNGKGICKNCIEEAISKLEGVGNENN